MTFSYESPVGDNTENYRWYNETSKPVNLYKARLTKGSSNNTHGTVLTNIKAYNTQNHKAFGTSLELGPRDKTSIQVDNEYQLMIPPGGFLTASIYSDGGDNTGHNKAKYLTLQFVLRHRQ